MTDEKLTLIRFHYIKSALFRVIHTDGMFGGVTPHGQIHIAFYSERLAIPQQTVQPLNADGSLGEELVDQRVAKEGVVRELEVGAMMDIDVARSLHKWLGDQIKVQEEAVAAALAAKGAKH